MYLEAELLRSHRDNRACMAAARRGIRAAQAGEGAPFNPYRRAAARTTGGPHERDLAECWEAARRLYGLTLLDQLELMLGLEAGETASQDAPGTRLDTRLDR